MKRTLALLVMLSLLTLPAAAQQQKVTVYTTLFEPTARLVFAEFEKDTGIRVEWVRLSSGEAVARLDAERNNPQASIWFGGVGLNHIEA
ncbi:MAG TPA: hypothetical protein VIL08_00355, partial [Limnochorda sp.]